MKISNVILSLSLIVSVHAYANEPDSAVIEQELRGMKVDVVGLMNTTITNLVNAMIRVGGTKNLQRDHTRWKDQNEARVVVFTSLRGGTPSRPVVVVEYSLGSERLGEDASRDVADVAFNYMRLKNPNRKVPDNFDVAMKCLSYGGQGLDPIEWCGFMNTQLGL